jgi:hypothetical protein
MSLHHVHVAMYMSSMASPAGLIHEGLLVKDPYSCLWEHSTCTAMNTLPLLMQLRCIRPWQQPKSTSLPSALGVPAVPSLTTCSPACQSSHRQKEVHSLHMHIPIVPRPLHELLTLAWTLAKCTPGFLFMALNIFQDPPGPADATWPAGAANAGTSGMQ